MDFKVHCRHAPQEGDSAEPQISSSSVLCDDLELKTERWGFSSSHFTARSALWKGLIFTEFWFCVLLMLRHNLVLCVLEEEPPERGLDYKCVFDV